MDRNGPAKDVEPPIKLIDDPRHGITAKEIVLSLKNKSDFGVETSKINSTIGETDVQLDDPQDHRRSIIDIRRQR